MSRLRNLRLLVLALNMALVYDAASGQSTPGTFVLEHEKDIAKKESGTHSGGGMTTGYHFFSKTLGLKTVFKKRTLHEGSSIGYHEQKEDEIYYIQTGNGIMQVNGNTFSVREGDAILTRPGSFHGLKPINGDLTVIIVYEAKPDK